VKNVLVGPKTATDIDKRVEKVLRGLGSPEPPLNLDFVRELLSLDRAYYTSADDGVLRETISRIKVAGLQVLKRPSLLIDAIRKLELKALCLPDVRRILIDETRPTAKQRWDEAHEIGHSLLPWHAEVTLGDNTVTLHHLHAICGRGRNGGLPLSCARIPARSPGRPHANSAVRYTARAVL
jgi:hypothetical protein